MKRIAIFLIGALLCSCRSTPSYAEAAEHARTKLQQEKVQDIILTPTSDDDGLLLFQVEGKRDGKPVSGSVEVRFEGSTPEVKLNLFATEKKL